MNLHEAVHPEQRETISPEQQERVGEAVELAAQPGAPRRGRAESLEDEAGAVPDPEPVLGGVAAGLGGEAE